MNRVKIAFIALFCAAFLAACGDTGDHFGEFRPNPQPTAKPTTGPTSSPTTQPTTGPTVCPTNCTPTPTPVGTPATVGRIVITVAGASPNPGTAGAYPLNITLYDVGGKLLTFGTPLVAPVIISSDASCVLGFNGVNQTGAGYAAYALTFTPATGPVQGQAPGSSVVALYNPGNASTGCSVPNPILVRATDSEGVAPPASFQFIGSQSYTVNAVSNFAPLTKPNPNAPGVYPIFLTMKQGGTVVPNGSPLNFPVVLTSNNICGAGFGTSPNITTGTATQALTFNAGTQIAYLLVEPIGTASCPVVSSPIILSISTAGNTLATYSFPVAGNP